MRTRILAFAIAVGYFALLPIHPAFALTDHPESFRDAYYLETHEHDLAGAIAGYERVVSDRSASQSVRDEAKRRLASCREDLRASDLAALMPSNALVFAELRRPGDHLEHLVKMLGLQAEGRESTGDGFAIPGEPMLMIPRRIILSSALISEAKAFQGLAFAMTDIDFQHDQPEFLLIAHPGDVNVLRGLIETGAQFVRPGEPIAGFSTIDVAEDDVHVTIAFTHRLVIVGSQRALVGDAIDRLTGDARDSLASSDLLQGQAASRDNAMLYALVNAPEVIKRLQSQAPNDADMRQGLMMGQAFLDIAHLNSISLALGSTPEGLSAEFVTSLDAGHTNMAYNLLRTPPMRGEALKLVPSGAAAVLAIGINPSESDEGTQQVMMKTSTVQAVTGLDLGRELFANIREAAVFVLPPDAGKRSAGFPVPDAAMVMAVGNPAKSEALWDFLLSIPAKAAGRADMSPKIEQIAGVEVRRYQMDEQFAIHFARTGSGIVVGTTPDAIAKSLATLNGQKNAADDGGLANATQAIGADTSIALIGHVGRIAQLAASHAQGEDAAIMGLIAQTAQQATATVTVDESETRLRIAARISGLPKVDEILDALAKAGVLGPIDRQYAATEDRADSKNQAAVAVD